MELLNFANRLEQILITINYTHIKNILINVNLFLNNSNIDNKKMQQNDIRIA